MDIIGKDITFALLVKGLEGQAKRQEAIAQNLANINTPNYQRRDVTFESELRNALNTQPNNLDTRQQILNNIQNIKPTIGSEPASINYRADGSGVDLDREMASESANTLLTQTSLTLIQQRLKLYRTAITEGKA